MAQLDKILEGNFVDQEANLIKSHLIAKCRFLGSVRALQSPRTSNFFPFYKRLLRRVCTVQKSYIFFRCK